MPTHAKLISTALALSFAGPALAVQHTLYVDISGDNTFAPFVTHGNPNVTGVGTFVFDDVANTMDWDIQLNGNDYELTQAHFYNINPNTHPYKANGESIFCWGGRWSSHDSFLVGEGFHVSNSHINNLLGRPQDWMLILHTEGGHFANDGGGLVEYNAALHETNDIGVTESGTWFNNRMGMTLDDLTLREDNPFYTADNTFLENRFGPGYFDREADTPYMDALGNRWLESDGNGGWQLTAEAVAAGYDLDTEYLFYRYADDGHDWDYGASEGAAGGVLQWEQVFGAGDYNEDGSVTAADYTVWADTFGSTTDLRADGNGDGSITAADYTVWADNFGAGAPGAAVPEPTSLVLLGLGGLALLSRRRGTAC